MFVVSDVTSNIILKIKIHYKLQGGEKLKNVDRTPLRVLTPFGGVVI